MATASAIKDAWITTLSAASNIGPNQVSTNYAVLESSSGCCVVVSFTGYEGTPATFGDQRDEMWLWFLQGYVKDTGNPIALKNNVFAFTDKIITATKRDRFLQDTIKAFGRITVTHDPEVMFQVGSVAWSPVEFTVEVQTWDD